MHGKILCEKMGCWREDPSAVLGFVRRNASPIGGHSLGFSPNSQKNG